MAQTDPNDWTTWQRCLPTGGKPAPDSEVSTGYWRADNGTAGTSLPVSTYFYAPDEDRPDKGVWMATVKGRDIDENDGEEWLSFVANRWPKLKAVSDSDYETALSTGMWRDGTPVEKRDGIGGNQPPADAVEALLAEAAEILAQAKARIAKGAAKSAEEADEASNFAKTITEKIAAVEAAFEVEKKPWRDGAKAVDTKFKVKGELSDLVKPFKMKVINPWQTEQDRLAEVAAAEARRKIAEAEAAGRPAPVPEAAAEPAKVSSGARGRKVSLYDEKYAEITNYEALAVALIRAKSTPVITAVESVATQLARSAMNVVGSSPADGMVVRSRKVSR